MQELADRNAKLEEHVGGQQKTIEQQQKQIDELKAMVEKLVMNKNEVGNKSLGEMK